MGVEGNVAGLVVDEDGVICADVGAKDIVGDVEVGDVLGCDVDIALRGLDALKVEVILVRPGLLDGDVLACIGFDSLIISKSADIDIGVASAADVLASSEAEGGVGAGGLKLDIGCGIAGWRGIEDVAVGGGYGDAAGAGLFKDGLA